MTPAHQKLHTAIETWLTATYGPRCSDFYSGCVVCRSWRIASPLLSLIEATDALLADEPRTERRSE